MTRAGAAVAAAAMLAGQAAAQEMISVELNKLEPLGDGAGCRSFFLFRNPTASALEAFELSLAILDRDGVIDRLLTIDAAPLPAERTTLKIFEIPELGCEAIGEIIVHDIPACAAAGGESPDCFAMVELVSLADAPLVK